MRLAVAFFYGGHWLHCGLTDGHTLVDSFPGVGVQRRPLPADVSEVYWLPGDNAAAWQRANARVGEPFTICAAFVCECLGSQCILPSTLEARLQRNS